MWLLTQLSNMDTHALDQQPPPPSPMLPMCSSAVLLPSNQVELLVRGSLQREPNCCSHCCNSCAPLAQTPMPSITHTHTHSHTPVHPDRLCSQSGGTCRRKHCRFWSGLCRETANLTHTQNTQVHHYPPPPPQTHTCVDELP